MMTMTAVAMKGTMSKDYETGTLSRAAATASALSNVLSATPPGPSLADIIHGRDVAWKLSSCGNVDNDDGANDKGWV
jgi:hypothetical protein